MLNFKGQFQIAFFAAVCLTVSCTIPEPRMTPPSSTSTPASSSSPVVKSRQHKSKIGASASVTKKKPRYRLLEHYDNKAFEDTVTRKIWAMHPVVYDASQSLAKLACKNSKLGGHRWRLPLAKDFIMLTGSKQDLVISEHAPFRINYDKDGPFWTRSKEAHTDKYYVVGFDKAKRYASVDADIGKYAAVCIQK